MNIIQRAKSPTPKLFQVLRNLGLVMAAVGGTLVASPVALPAVVVTIAGYLTVAGGVLSAVSQLAVEDRASESEIDGEDSD